MAKEHLRSRKSTKQILVPSKTPRVVPRRKYVYIVTLGAREYKVTMNKPLPKGKEVRELVRMAKAGKFFEVSKKLKPKERMRTKDAPSPAIEVERTDMGPGSAKFNKSEPQSQVDTFQTAVVRAAETDTFMTAGIHTQTKKQKR